jgi:hypothetical protein
VNDADRVLRVHLHPMYEGASDREVARIAGVTREFARDERQQIDAERGIAELIGRADELRALDGFSGDAVAYLHSLLDRATMARTRRLLKTLERVAALPVPPTKSNGGARPPEQPRGASPTRNGDGGPSQDARGSKVTGLGAYR